jgi:hypothetical protein
MTVDTIGAHRPDDPRGWLLFESLPIDLQNAEDSRLGADRQRVRDNDHSASSFTREATDTERLLLSHLGYAVPTGPLTTYVRWLSPGVRQRRWPALEEQETAS